MCLYDMDISIEEKDTLLLLTFLDFLPITSEALNDSFKNTTEIAALPVQKQKRYKNN